MLMSMMSIFPITIEQYGSWLAQQGNRPGTIAEYSRKVRVAVDAGDWLAPLRMARSRSSWLVAYSALASYAEAAGLGDVRSQLKKVAPPRRPPKVRRPVPMDAWAAIADRVDRLREPDRGLMQILSLSGLRIGDVFGITRSQAQRVVETGAAAIFQKGDVEREWAPDVEVRQALARLVGQPGWTKLQDLVAANSKTAGGRVRRLLRWVCDEAGVERCVPHALRHSMATALDERHKTIEEIAAVLGHASTRTTQAYIHISPARQSGAVSEVVGDLLRRGRS